MQCSSVALDRLNLWTVANNIWTQMGNGLITNSTQRTICLVEVYSKKRTALSYMWPVSQISQTDFLWHSTQNLCQTKGEKYVKGNFTTHTEQTQFPDVYWQNFDDFSYCRVIKWSKSEISGTLVSGWSRFIFSKTPSQSRLIHEKRQ